MTTLHYEVRVESDQRRLRHIHSVATLPFAKAMFDDLSEWAWSEVANNYVTLGIELVEIPEDADGFLDCDHERIIKSIYYYNANGEVVEGTKEDI